MWISRVINVNFCQILVHVSVIFWNLIFVCITIRVKLIKRLYNSRLRKLPVAHGEVSVMQVISPRRRAINPSANRIDFCWELKSFSVILFHINISFKLNCFENLLQHFRNIYLANIYEIATLRIMYTCNCNQDQVNITAAAKKRSCFC